MKVKVMALVMRHKDTKKILDIQPICDIYCEIHATYPVGLVSVEEVQTFAKDTYGKQGEMIMSTEIADVKSGKGFFFQGEAKDFPSLGKVMLSFETKEIDWIDNI